MNKSIEQFTATNKATIENLQTIANTTFAGVESLASLNLGAARTAVEDAAANVKALLAVKDVQALVALQQSMAQPAAEKAVAYSRSVYDIVTKSVNEIVKLFEGQASELNKNVTSVIDNALKNAPAGSEVAVTAVKSAMSAANSAIEQMNKAAKQVTEMAEANVAAANAATVKLVKKAA